MNAPDWQALLAQWTRELTAHPTNNRNERRLPSDTHGFGFAGASEEQVEAAERRLGVRLPPSYREFLKATNGLLQPFSYVAACGGDFWPAEQIDWFRARNADWIEAYADTSEGRDLPATLEISHDGDSGAYLLNPRVVGADGEWEAWLFANWVPGARRYRSFAAMMRSRYDAFRGGGVQGF
jgi:SMI1 / KNR4 family (SUKH-1)